MAKKVAVLAVNPVTDSVCFSIWKHFLRMKFRTECMQ